MSIVDITWGLMFLVPNGMIMWQRRNSISPVMKLTAAMVTFWAVRLSYHIGRRHKNEDYRYVYLRSKWKDSSPIVR